VLRDHSPGPVRCLHPMDEIDIWRTANIVLQQRGEAAAKADHGMPGR
jgi:hypothetical protein